MRRLADRPFATALATLLLMNAVAGLSRATLATDALQGLVPSLFLDFLVVAYGIAGLLLLAGMAIPRTNIEASGCILAFSGLMIRSVAVIYILGANVKTVTAALFYVIFMWACAERLRQIINDDKIVRIHDGLHLKLGEEPDDASTAGS